VPLSLGVLLSECMTFISTQVYFDNKMQCNSIDDLPHGAQTVDGTAARLITVAVLVTSSIHTMSARVS